jgi:hypothetical protein
MSKQARALYCSVLVLWASVAFAQGKSSRTDNTVIKLQFSNTTGLVWEQSLSAANTLSLFTGYSFGIQADDFTDKQANFIISPDAYLEFRHYYNLQKRYSADKNTRNHAASFFFGRLESIFAVHNKTSYSFLASQGWGIQRNIGAKTRHLVVGIQAGLSEHAFFNKPLTGGFRTIRLEPVLSVSLAFCF